MRRLTNLVRTFVREDEAVAVTEYAIMLALIVLVAMGAISGVGTSVARTYAGLDTAVGAAAPL